jgi:putative oxidoreductase
MSTPAMVWRRRAVAASLWGATVVAGLGIGLAGAAKVATRVWQPLFAGWGYPPWLVGVVGMLEIVGGVCLFVPRLAFYSALSLTVIMIAAFATLRLHPGGALGWGATPLVYALVLSAIAAGRWKNRYPLRRSRDG